MLLKIRTMIQGEKTADKHVQDFEKAALEGGYEGFPLIVEIKQSLNPTLRKCLSEICLQPVTIEEWYNESIMIDQQWCITKAEEAFYRKVNQSRSSRKPSLNQTGMPSIWNDTWLSYNNLYRQGGYQNRGQISLGSVVAPHQNYCLEQKNLNAMEVD